MALFAYEGRRDGNIFKRMLGLIKAALVLRHRAYRYSPYGPYTELNNYHRYATGKDRATCIPVANGGGIPSKTFYE